MQILLPKKIKKSNKFKNTVRDDPDGVLVVIKSP